MKNRVIVSVFALIVAVSAMICGEFENSGTAVDPAENSETQTLQQTRA